MMYYYQQRFVVLLVLQCLCWLPLLCQGCPSSCKCKWKGGKQTVDCIDENLITIPDGMDQGTQVLDFTGNNLKTLPRERFQRMGLLNLQKIYLTKCRISHIDDRAFKGLTNLVELYLSHNVLTEIPTETFLDYQSLMRLTLSGNPIHTLEAGSFQHLSFLSTLELSNCEIDTIQENAFSGLDSLEWLKLDGNRLASIRGSNVLPDTLHGIDLHHNPWTCDCRLMDLRTWLLNSNIPHAIEPKCVTPKRLRDITIKSLNPNDLACLPDVTPTTLYLEIGEGKNVSLLCRVSAVPEARVSWWFQGRILQNDSMLAPGLHLYYFVEEGEEEKTSELFIFNTNTEDNGTFVCVAENPAGRSQSNYTIRIVVKKEPVVGPPPFPYEYVITVVAACAVLALFIVIAIVLCIVRCHRQRRRRRKKERSKVVALHHQQHGKAGLVGTGNQITRVGAEIQPGPAKVNGTIVMGDRYQHEMIMVAAGTREHLHNNDGSRPGISNNQYGSPRSLRNYQVDQNPDLINDTESVGKERRKGKADGDNSTEEGERENSGPNSYQEAMENIIHDYENGGGSNKLPGMTTSESLMSLAHQMREMDPQYPIHMSTLPRGSVGCSRDMYQHHSADVHLSPGRFLDSDGYPIDYGLPKLPTHLPLVPQQPPAAFYRTLPHNRPARLDTSNAATPTSRFSREAEFLARSAQPAYEHYSPPDVRYTVDGYPCATPPNQTQTLYSMESHGSFPDNTYLPSPPAPYKGDAKLPTSTSGNASTCTSPMKDSAPWPGANHHVHHSTGAVSKKTTPNQDSTAGTFSNPVGSIVIPQCFLETNVKREEPSRLSQVKEEGVKANHNLHHPIGVLTESPDEGYVGDSVEGTDM